ncbi:hypothetical protein BDR22DRAFT_605899 [Usnea florida]
MLTRNSSHRHHSPPTSPKHRTVPSHPSTPFHTLTGSHSPPHPASTPTHRHHHLTALFHRLFPFPQLSNAIHRASARQEYKRDRRYVQDTYTLFQEHRMRVKREKKKGAGWLEEDGDGEGDEDEISDDDGIGGWGASVVDLGTYVAPVEWVPGEVGGPDPWWHQWGGIAVVREGDPWRLRPSKEIV